LIRSVDFLIFVSLRHTKTIFTTSSLYIVDPRGLEPPRFRLKGGYSTIELRIPMLRIHLRLHCNNTIAITTVGYTIPIRAPCPIEIISMDTRHPLPVISIFGPRAPKEKPLHSKRMRKSIPKAPSQYRHNPPQFQFFASNEKRIHVSRTREQAPFLNSSSNSSIYLLTPEIDSVDIALAQSPAK
jgi:hypothetical protein